MTVHEALYRSIKEAMPNDIDIVFNNLNENKEECGICFKGAGVSSIQHLDGKLANRNMRMIINYNFKDTFAGYDYGQRVIDNLIQMHNIAYKDDETGELLVYINKIKLTGDVNFLKKNPNNGLNCFSVNFLITYGKL